MNAASIESSDTWKKKSAIEEDPIKAGKKLMRKFAGSLIATLVATVVMVFVGIAMAKADGKGEFMRSSGELLRGRTGYQEHMAGLTPLYWFPEQTPLIANLHDGAISDTEHIRLEGDLGTRVALILSEGGDMRGKLASTPLDPRLADFLVRLHEAGGLGTGDDGRPLVPLAYEVTDITQWAGMRLHQQDGRKAYERNLGVTATLIGIDHEGFETLHRVAAVTLVER